MLRWTFVLLMTVTSTFAALAAAASATNLGQTLGWGLLVLLPIVLVCFGRDLRPHP